MKSLFAVSTNLFVTRISCFGTFYRTLGRRCVSLTAALIFLLGGYSLSAQNGPHPSATLSFTPITPHALGDIPFLIAATSPSSGAVTYTVLGGPAVLSRNILTITGGGVVRLLARQEAVAPYGAMTAHTSFMVSTATSQTMQFSQIGGVVKSAIASDTPNFLFLDSNGQFFLQNSDSQYDKVPKNHVWELYTGKDAHDPKLKLSKANSQFDTQSMCESGSPVYRKLYSTQGISPGSGGYADGNFCDLVGVWVDPDTGDWYGVVHNELYPNIPRIDVISYAISKDHGKSWTLKNPIATSPYGAANKKNLYYDYGEGDPRLVVDTGSGYFYLFYNSRIMKPTGKGRGFSAHEWEHVSRARIQDKMSPSSWEKYYNGGWSKSPGIDWTCDPAGPSPCKTGGDESSLSSNIGADNDPTIGQTFIQPASEHSIKDLAAYSNSTLHTASVSWNVYLGKYIAFAEDRNLSLKSGDYDDPAEAMSFYVSDDLATQRWTYAGNIPYKNASWYRWFVDPGNLTSSKTIGATFLAYCSISCSNPKNDSEYIKIAVSLQPGATPSIYFSGATDSDNSTYTYLIAHGNTAQAVNTSDSWTFVPVPQDGGFFTIQHGKKCLGVAKGNSGRAWGAKVKLGSPISAIHHPTEMSRQQWYFERIRFDNGASSSRAQYRLINRYSGLALSFTGKVFTAKGLANAVMAPIRDWDAPAGTFKVWKAADQELVF